MEHGDSSDRRGVETAWRAAWAMQRMADTLDAIFYMAFLLVILLAVMALLESMKD